MRSPGINGEGELRGQPANPGSPGKMAFKMECVCVCEHCSRCVHQPLDQSSASWIQCQLCSAQSNTGRMIQTWHSKAPFVHVGKAEAMASSETAEQWPWTARWIKSWLRDSRVCKKYITDRKNWHPVLCSLHGCWLIYIDRCHIQPKEDAQIRSAHISQCRQAEIMLITSFAAAFWRR